MEILPLTIEHQKHREESLALAARLIDTPPPFPVHKVQALYDVVLREFPTNHDAIGAIGFAFGEFFVRRGTFEWATVDDQWGSEPSIAWIGYDAVAHPLLMMRKRIEREEQIDLSQLIDDTVWTIESRFGKGEVGIREAALPAPPTPLFRRIRLALRRHLTKDRA